MVKINVEPNNTLNQNNPGEIEDITPLSGSNAKANKFTSYLRFKNCRNNFNHNFSFQIYLRCHYLHLKHW